MQSLQRQYDAVCELEHFLHTKMDELGSIYNNYGVKVTHLRETGLSKEVEEGFSKNLEQDGAVIEGFIHDIVSNDLPYIGSNRQKLYDALQAARRY